jgi:hypothetical protein
MKLFDWIKIGELIRRETGHIKAIVRLSIVRAVERRLRRLLTMILGPNSKLIKSIVPWLRVALAGTKYLRTLHFSGSLLVSSCCSQSSENTFFLNAHTSKGSSRTAAL